MAASTTAKDNAIQSEAQCGHDVGSGTAGTTLATAEWIRTAVLFSPPLDLSDPNPVDATVERALGAWINADECGATLNLQLSAGVG